MKLRKLWYHHCHQRHKVHDKVRQIVVRVVCAKQKQNDGYSQQKLLGRGVLISIVDLLPHIEIVISSSVEFEGDASDVVKHEVGAGHVGDVGESPGDFLRHAGYDIEENLEADDENWMDSPGTCGVINMCTRLVSRGRTFCIDPLRVEIGESGLVCNLL